eukprot:4051973-Pleurochrysis_carterae.AAC.2
MPQYLILCGVHTSRPDRSILQAYSYHAPMAVSGNDSAQNLLLGEKRACLAMAPKRCSMTRGARPRD